MKFLSISIFFTFHILLAHSQVIATTPDGRRVILNKNKTWEYADSSENASCRLGPDFSEPKSSKEMYKTLKQIGASIDELKEYVTVDNECKPGDVKIISFSEQLGNGIYNTCVKGIKMRYHRTGSVFGRFNEKLCSGEF